MGFDLRNCSVNYLILKENSGIDNTFILALLNSRIMNYVFRKFSTNSNVNGYEIDNLPIPKNILHDIQVQVKKIAENFRMPYFTLSPTFSICPIHGYMPGRHDYCPICEQEDAEHHKVDIKKEVLN